MNILNNYILSTKRTVGKSLKTNEDIGANENVASWKETSSSSAVTSHVGLPIQLWFFVDYAHVKVLLWIVVSQRFIERMLSSSTAAHIIVTTSHVFSGWGWAMPSPFS